MVDIPVDNVVLVAVVDAREHLLHQDSCILLCELPSGDNLVEEFSSFADPIGEGVRWEGVEVLTQ
jgi:hypothetical protein